VLKGERIFQHFFLLYDILTCVEQSQIHYLIGRSNIPPLESNANTRRRQDNGNSPE